MPINAPFAVRISLLFVVMFLLPLISQAEDKAYGKKDPTYQPDPAAISQPG